MVRAGFLEGNEKLTINYGVRDTITVPYKAAWGNQIFFDPALYNPSQAPKINPRPATWLWVRAMSTTAW